MFHGSLSVFSLVLMGWLSTTASFAADPLTPQTPKPAPASPLTPEESLKHFQIDPDCRIELVAAEPDVSAPVSIAFDEKGQLWVVEMHDYPNGPAPGEPGKSRIRVLTDEDGDGKYSNPTVFVDQLLFANSLMHWDGGILVTTDGQLIYFKDTDHDGKADLREVWFEGFATENPQLRCNHPTFGPDNWIYVANGLRNGKVKAVRPKWPQPAPESAKLGEPVDIAGRDFRFNPFTGECEAVSGYGQFGLTFDDEGNRYVCSNRNPCMKVIIEERHLKLNPNLAVPSVYEDVSPAGEKSKLYPISRAWTTSNLHAGQFSAACGLIFYRGTALPSQFYNQSFTCDPTGNLVHFNDTLGVRELKDREFLASDETWFRPVNTAMGPDGALYLVDMYRAVVEHPEYMPTELKTRSDLSIGAERGRIWRIVAQTQTSEPGGVSPRTIFPAEPTDIAKLVLHRNGWHRDMAHRMIVESQMKAAEPALREIIQSQPPRFGIAESLRILDGLGLVRPEDLIELIAKDPVQGEVPISARNLGLSSFRWKAEALRLAEPMIANNPQLEVAILKVSESGALMNSDAFHRCLGQLGDRGTKERLRLTVRDLRSVLEYQFINERTKLSIALAESKLLPEALTQVLAEHSGQGKSRSQPVLGFLVEVAARQGTVDEVAALMQQLLKAHDTGNVLSMTAAMKSQGLTIHSLLASSPPLSKAWDEFANKAISTASKPISNDDPAAVRALIESLKCLTEIDHTRSEPVLHGVLEAPAIPEVHLAALESVSRMPDPAGTDLLLLNLSQRTPSLRSVVMSALLTTEPRITKLLDLVESNQISFLEIGSTRLASLQQVANPAIQERLQKLIAANAPADRSKVLEEYQAALTHEHDPQRGRELFAKNCAQCHKIGDLGVDVAPNISDSRVKTHEQLLVDILDPNRAIDNNYFSYTLVDTSGKVSTGIISSETSSSVTMKQPEGKVITVLRSEIEQLKPNGVSLMPVGFEKQLSVAQLADVISFIKNWRYLDGDVPKEVIK